MLSGIADMKKKSDETDFNADLEGLEPNAKKICLSICEAVKSSFIKACFQKNNEKNIEFNSLLFSQVVAAKTLATIVPTNYSNACNMLFGLYLLHEN